MISTIVRPSGIIWLVVALAVASGAQTTCGEESVAATKAFFDASRALEGKRFDEAIDLFTKAITLDLSPSHVSAAYQNRGIAYRSKGDDERASADFERAIEFDPTNAGAYINRGLGHAHRGDHDLAIRDYNEALRFDPKMVAAVFNRALSWRETGNVERALQDVNEALRLDPKLPQGYVCRGELLSATKPAAARRDFETAKKIAPEMPDVWLGLARLDFWEKRYESVVANYEKIMALQVAPPVRAFALNGAAWMRATCPTPRIRNGKKAIKEAQEACELTSWQSSACVDTLAAAFAEARRYQDAANYQWLALSLLDPDDAGRAEAEERLHLYKRDKPYRENPRRTPSPAPSPSRALPLPSRFGKPS